MYSERNTTTPHPSSDDLGIENGELIAIVGMSCRWPGGIRTPEQLWEFICAKKSAYREFDNNKLNIGGFHHVDNQRPGSMQSRGAYLLEEDPKLFDHAFFGISGTEVASMDPAQRKMLEVVYEAFESAGEPKEKYSGSSTGVFVGNFNSDHFLIQARDSDFLSPHSSTGASSSMLSNRINYLMNLKGPSMTIDTACSSSLFALHLAANAIRQGDCDTAIVGGSNLIMTPDVQLMMTKLGALSPTSSCSTFDASANGYGRGEGFAAFYLMKLSDAMRSGYPVRAVVRGTAINSNGRSVGLTHPSAEGQEAVIRQSYKKAQLDPAQTGYFEAHGTGTPVGDPVEVAAIGNVFSSSNNSSPLLIGSVKTNIGHTEAASGLAGVMKAVLALEANMIPPTRGLVDKNPQVDFKKANVQVATELTPWPADKLRRASVSAFGYGGANAHCILDHISTLYTDPCAVDSAVSLDHDFDLKSLINNPPCLPTRYRPSKVQSHNAIARRMVLLPFSAYDNYALTRNSEATIQAVKDHPLADIAYTLSSRRSRFRYRSYAILASEGDGEFGVRSLTEPQKVQATRIPAVGFIFTGQGAQWKGMAHGLLEYEVFRNTIAYLDWILSHLSFAPAWKIQDVLWGAEEPSVDLPEVSQTVCTALQLALVELMRCWDLNPKVVVGHSSGEIAAAYTAGCLSLSEAITIAYCRGITVSKNKQDGLMLAVGLGEEEVRPIIENAYHDTGIAAVNSANSVTLSGGASDIKSLSELFHGKGVFSKILKTGGNAYHSSHMLHLGLIYESLLTQALDELNSYKISEDSIEPCQALWISSVFPHAAMSKAATRPLYWRQNLESKVHFQAAVEQMIDSSKVHVDVLIEIGPHSALKSPLTQIWAAKRGENSEQQFYYSALTRRRDGMDSLLQLCGSLFCANFPVDLEAVNAQDCLLDGRFTLCHGRICTALPSYSFSYGSILYNESRFSKDIRLRKHIRHDLLGSKQAGCSLNSPSWRNVLRIKDLPWLEHHKLLPYPVFPAAGYICMALEAAYQTFSEDHPVDKISEYTLRDIVIHAAMRIPEGDQGREVIFNLEKRHASNSDSYKFKISSVTQVDGVWTDHCRGEIMPHREMDSKSLPQFHKQLLGPNDRRILDSQKWYNTFTETGLGYGRAFQGILNLTSDPQMNTVAADIDLDPTKGLFKNIESSYLIHPASLDACFQLSIIAGFNGHSEIAQNAYIPVSFKRISIFCPDEPPTPFGTAICHSSRRGIRRLYAQTQLTNLSGVPLVDVEDLRCVAYGERSNIKESVRKPYRNLVWKPDINSMSSSAAYAMFSSTVAIEKELVNGLSDLNRLSAYVVVEIAKNFAFQSRSTAQHVENFISWARNCAETDLPFIEEARYCKNRSAVISSLSTQMKGRTEVRLIKRVFDNLESIIDGSTTGLEVALQDGLLNQLYASSVGIAGAYPQLRRIIELCAHQNPHMDILEIGAGTGGATRIVLEALQADSDEKLFEKYTFTDISTAFLSPAQAQFDFCSTSMAYGTLDIESDPGDQGYEQRYDLVIASESLHTVEKIEKALRHSRMLLRPGGRLIIVETTRALIGHGLVLGTFPDYWVGKEEGRFDSPFMTAAQWDTVLKRAGFSGIDVRLDDYPQPWNIASVLVATVAMEPVVSIDKSDSVWLIGVPRLKDFSELLASQFAQHNVHVERACEKVPQNAQVIWFLPADIWKDVKWFTTAKWLVQQSRSIIWITEKDDNDSFNGSMAIVQGAVRVIAAENPHLHHTVIDIQKKANECDLGLATELVKLVLESRAPHPPQMQDREFIWKDQCLHISRLVPDLDRNNVFQLSQISDSIQSMSLGEQKPFKIAYEIPGMLLSNYFKEDRSFSTPIPEDYIVAKTKAMGLNWKDVAVATGRFDLNNSSTEFSGVITQIGAKVSDFSVGDHVYGLAFGHFGNYVRLPASFARRMPIESSFVDMATIPVVFTTALYAFRHVARLQPGELVLIQSGTGGLGIAAIQVAQMIGANIFATAGSKEKRAYLHEVFQIPSSHIFDSREIPSKRVLLQATDGRGFDVVLNTSSGFVMDSTWSAIAAKGRFVDIGRVDVHDHGSLYMEPFNRNASFSSFDLGRLDPPTLAELMGEVDTLVQANAIRPISPVTEFDIGNLGKALLNLSEGKHIGKMVVTYGDVNSMIRLASSFSRASFDASAMYIVAGGLGGLGRSLISWMIDRGARHIVTLSRKSETKAETSWFHDLIRAKGVYIEQISCDITVGKELGGIIKNLEGQRPIRGIVHAAMALHDKLFTNLSFEEWEKGLAAKVQGTLNLHHATSHIPLDFFVMTSSVSTQIAQPTQAAYCAANSFQDHFARYRRSIGLPGTTIAFGLIHEVGELGRRIDVQNSMSRNGLYGTTESGFLQLLDAAFLPDLSMERGNHDCLSTAHTVTSLEPALLLKKKIMNDNSGITTQPRWHHDMRFSHILRQMANLVSNSSKSVGNNDPSAAVTVLPAVEVDDLMRKGRRDEAKRAVVVSIIGRVADMLFASSDSIEPSLSVSAYGIDSLVAAELRSWFIATYSCAIPFLELLDTKTSMHDLADLVLAKSEIDGEKIGVESA